MSLYSLKSAQMAVQAWQAALPLGKSIFDFYPSQGDLTTTGSLTIPTTLDGPIQVVRYGALTVNHVITTQYRCRGLMILCDSFTGGASGGINMTARGAAGQPWWPWYDLTIPNTITLSSKRMLLKEVLDYFRTSGYFIGDSVLWSQSMQMGWLDLPGVTGSLAAGVKILDSTKCGARKTGVSVGGTQYSVTQGGTGNAGTQGTGSGGSGSGDNPGGISFTTPPGGRGCPWGGGAGAGGNTYCLDYGGYGSDGLGVNGDVCPSAYGGKGGFGSGSGGGAGNTPGGSQNTGSGAGIGGDGTGGVLIVISKNGFNVANGFLAQADGMPGGNAGTYYCGGSGSGGGFQAWIRGTGSTNTQSGTRRCNGGSGGTQGSYSAAGVVAGAAGGAGAVLDLQFSDLAWS